MACDSSIRPSVLVTTVVLATGAGGWSTPARACSVAPGITQRTPESGQPLPSGSRLLLQGYFELDPIIVEVDGAPATLRLDEAYPRPDDYAGAYVIEPVPPEGSTVSLRDCSFESLDPCEAQARTWVVSAPDVTAPAAAADVELGIYDHVDIDTSGDTCSGGEVFDVTLYISAMIPAEAPGGAQRQALLEVFDLDRQTVVRSVLRPVPAEGGVLEVRQGLVADVPHPLEGRFCVDVTVLDLAGQRSEITRTCDPHHVAIDPDQGEPRQGFELPEEPDWEAFDGLERSGCACGSTPGGSSPGALLGLGLLALGLRRCRAHAASEG